MAGALARVRPSLGLLTRRRGQVLFEHASELIPASACCRLTTGCDLAKYFTLMTPSLGMSWAIS